MSPFRPPRQWMSRRVQGGLLLTLALLVAAVGMGSLVDSMRSGPRTNFGSSGSVLADVIADGSLVFPSAGWGKRAGAVGNARLLYAYKHERNAGPALFRRWLQRETFELKAGSSQNYVSNAPLTISNAAVKAVEPAIRTWLGKEKRVDLERSILGTAETSRTTLDARGVVLWWISAAIWIGVPLVCVRAAKRLIELPRDEFLRRAECPKCHYSLIEMIGERCPECGERFTSHEARMLMIASERRRR